MPDQGHAVAIPEVRHDARPSIAIGALASDGRLVAKSGSLKGLLKPIVDCGLISALELGEADVQSRCKTSSKESAVAREYRVRILPVSRHKGAVRSLVMIEETDVQPEVGNAIPLPFADAFTLLVAGAIDRRRRIRAKPAASASFGPGEVDRLTRREEQVLRLIAWGHPIKAIAKRLCVSAKTVEFHRSAAMKKSGLTQRTQLMRLAVLRGWMDLEP